MLGQHLSLGWVTGTPRKGNFEFTNRRMSAVRSSWGGETAIGWNGGHPHPINCHSCGLFRTEEPGNRWGSSQAVGRLPIGPARFPFTLRPVTSLPGCPEH